MFRRYHLVLDYPQVLEDLCLLVNQQDLVDPLVLHHRLVLQDPLVPVVRQVLGSLYHPELPGHL